ncbi:MAG TPA: LysR family transcriptional regulator [Bdellovibrionales bacterium]|jgi:DNA-binding transcriptional LysR family regulator|nr:LysR family transcriptional regulator [Bdellovibrionales bacterium]
MLPQPTDLTYFLEVASTLNISRAAERLGISQPTLSLAMQRLETQIGTALLLRQKSGVRLTKAGARIAQQGRELIEQWGKLRSDALKDENEVRGRLTVGCHASIALFSLENFVPQLFKTYPDLSIDFQHDLSRKITERVISFELDIGIVVNPVPHPDLRLVHLADDEVTLYRAPGNVCEDVLICEPDLAQTQDLLHKLKSGKKGFKFTRVVHSRNLEVVARLTAAGAGIGVLPGRVAARESSKLKPVGSGSPTFHDRIALIYRADALKGAAGRVVAKAITESFKEGKHQ